MTDGEGLDVVDLSQVRTVLAEITTLVENLDGIDLDETDAVRSQSKGRSRQERAQASQDMNLLASRFELCAQLVRVQYWAARGEADPLAWTAIGREGKR